jgi:hypothetical protein
MSGLRARDVRGAGGGVSVTETISGRVVSLVARYGIEPARRRRLVYGIGGGIGAYKVDVENHFDPVSGERPGVEASQRMTYQPWGVQVHADVRYYVVPKVALRAYAAAHAAGSVRTESVAVRDHMLQSHSVSMSWATAGVGLALHY